MCLYPQLIRNPKYKANKKNGGAIPHYHDGRVLHVPIGCGECMECRKRKGRDWQIRLLEDMRHHTNGKFITLTFSNEKFTEYAKKANEVVKKTIRKTIVIPKGMWRWETRNYYRKEVLTRKKQITGYDLDNAIAIAAMRDFNERWRKKHGKALRHFMVTELGHEGTENIHLHGIVWTNESYEEIRNRWGNGFVWPRPGTEEKNAYVNEQTVNYIIKYIIKKDEDHKTYKSQILVSPGIGAGYMDRMDVKNNVFKESKTKETYRTRTGHEVALPIYWRNKIYTEEEREALWLHKLDKQQRYVCGEKIDISRTEKNYWKILKWYQRTNKELGYGDGKPDWNRAEYERERREMLHGERTKTPSAGS